MVGFYERLLSGYSILVGSSYLKYQKNLIFLAPFVNILHSHLIILIINDNMGWENYEKKK